MTGHSGPSAEHPSARGRLGVMSQDEDMCMGRHTREYSQREVKQRHHKEQRRQRECCRAEVGSKEIKQAG
jgi:hypothetical protein